MNKLDICKRTRKIAADSLLVVLKEVLKSNRKVSEVDFRNKWLKELRKHKEIFPEGWYSPPPHGIGILFGTSRNTKRLNFSTLRDKKSWPKNTVYLNRIDGVITLYISPVDKKTGVIGDFGLTIYLGKNKDLQEHLKTILNFDKKIFSKASSGKQLKNLYSDGTKILAKQGYTNGGWVSTSDPAGINMGHTVPLSKFALKPSEVSKARIFFNRLEETKITNNFALTIEPRPRKDNNPKLPTAFFHTIALFKENREKELLTDFDKIFKLVEMDYML